MWNRFKRLFVIKTRWEAYAVIYGLALGATERGFHYMATYTGLGGYLLFVACAAAVFMAGAKILDATRVRSPNVERRRAPVEPQTPSLS